MTALETLADEALTAFWDTVVRWFPEATTGDLSPGTAIALGMVAEQAIDEWIMSNVHTQDCDVEVGYRFRLFRLEDRLSQVVDSSNPGVVTAVDDLGVWGRMEPAVASSAPGEHLIHWPTRDEFCRSTIPSL